MSALIALAKAFLPSLIEHGVEMYKDKQVRKDNIKSTSTKVAAGAVVVSGVLEAVQNINPGSLPTDPTLTQALLGLVAVVCFLFRKYQAAQ